MAAPTVILPFFPAGLKLGIKSEELQKFFEDEEDGTVGFQGFPGSMTTTTVKGRGARTLGYNIGGQPTRVETVFGETAALPKLPTQPETPEEPETPEQRFLSSFIGDMGTPGVVGAEALGRAQEYGYDKPEILKMAEEEGLTFGEQASKSMGLSDLPQYIGELGDQSGQVLGQEALDRARQTMSDDLIKRLAQQQNISFGEKAAKELNLPSFGQKSELSQYIGAGGDPTGGTLGLTAVNKARSAGLTDAQIRAQARAQGKSFGTAAAQSLDTQAAPRLSSFIDSAGDPNKQVMGKSAVDRARAQGLSDSQIRNLAATQGIRFASGVSF